MELNLELEEVRPTSTNTEPAKYRVSFYIIAPKIIAEAFFNTISRLISLYGD